MRVGTYVTRPGTVEKGQGDSKKRHLYKYGVALLCEMRLSWMKGCKTVKPFIYEFTANHTGSKFLVLVTNE